jgi:hypothetical protein
MSGVAITAFVLSLVAIVPSSIGLWIASAVPLGLGLVGMFTIDPARRRGRGLAIAAVAISLPLGALMYHSHAEARAAVRDMGAYVLAALRGGDEGKLEPWLEEAARGEGVAPRIRERYRAVEAAFGPYGGTVSAGNPWLGAAPLLTPPSPLTEVGSTGGKTDGSDLPLGSVVWVRADFEKGLVHVAFLLKSSGGAAGAAASLTSLQEKRPAAVVRDVRFFRSP